MPPNAPILATAIKIIAELVSYFPELAGDYAQDSRRDLPEHLRVRAKGQQTVYGKSFTPKPERPAPTEEQLSWHAGKQADALNGTGGALPDALMKSHACGKREAHATVLLPVSMPNMTRPTV